MTTRIVRKPMTYDQHLAVLKACYPMASGELIELAARGAMHDDAPLAVALPDSERHKLADEVVDRMVAVLRSSGGGIRDLIEVQ